MITQLCGIRIEKKDNGKYDDKWYLITNKRIYYIEKENFLPGRLSTMKWRWRHCWSLLISGTGNVHQCPLQIHHCSQLFTFTTQSKLSEKFKNSTKNGGRFVQGLGFSIFINQFLKISLRLELKQFDNVHSSHFGYCINTTKCKNKEANPS